MHLYSAILFILCTLRVRFFVLCYRRSITVSLRTTCVLFLEFSLRFHIVGGWRGCFGLSVHRRLWNRAGVQLPQVLLPAGPALNLGLPIFSPPGAGYENILLKQSHLSGAATMCTMFLLWLFKKRSFLSLPASAKRVHPR